MAETTQYLRLDLRGRDYLLPSMSGFAIEQREALTVNRAASGYVVAWKTGRTGRWPAYALDQELRPVKRDDWTRAVFIDAAPNAVGLAVDEVQLLSRTQTQVSPFHPPGAPKMQAGHLFSGAWVRPEGIVLVLNPKTLAAYLQSLGS